VRLRCCNQNRLPLPPALVILAAHVNARLAVCAHANPELNGLAAHLAIFDVLLTAHGSVHGDLKRLPAVRAVNLRGLQRIHAAPIAPQNEA